jgi:hypothetical protein
MGLCSHLTGASCFDCRVERQQLGLVGNAADHIMYQVVTETHQIRFLMSDISSFSES